MPTSFAHLCNRDEASSEYDRLKDSGLLNLDLKPMPYGGKIAIPVLEGDMEIEFEEVQRSNPHDMLSTILANPPKTMGKIRRYGDFSTMH